MLRDATPDDWGALRLIFRRASLSNEADRVALLGAPGHLVWREPSGVGPFRVRVAVGDHGGVVGFATVLVTPNVAELHDLFVDPAFMRRGVGRALVNDAGRLAARAGCTTLAVIANPHAAAFYGATGFGGGESVATPLGVGSRLSLQLPTTGPSPT